MLQRMDSSWWTRNRAAVLHASVALLAAVAAAKLGTELYRLVADPGFTGAIDLRLRHTEVRQWFAGLPVYTAFSRIMYPPQAYAVLWPLLGWLELAAARWLWAGTTVAALVWLCRIAVRESGAHSAGRAATALAITMVLSMNAVGVTVGNGQLSIHVVTALAAGLLLLRRPDAGWSSDLAAAALLLFAAIKPTLTVPFVWVVLVTTRRVRPLALTAVGYILLTLLAAQFQPEPAHVLVRQWLAQDSPVFGTGYGDVQSLLALLGRDSWAMPLAALLLSALGVWTWRHRHADVWILIGVAALVARFWMYHRVYDDVLILLPMVALFRIAVGHSPDVTQHATRAYAGTLLGIAIVAMLAPARLETASTPLNWLFIGGHVAVWLVMLAFLAAAAERRSHSGIHTVRSRAIGPVPSQ
jgi:hypothetical protein